jgi:SAM-dependent methyltransferase
MDILNRFSDRVENYIRYRPDYPEGIVSFLSQEGLLSPDSVIADIGSGTGISTALFLKNGNTVFAVEPNKEMREAAERLLKEYPGFHSLEGKAEETNIPSATIDLITAGQAFHWFDRQQCKLEFKRIGKSAAHIVLMWNDRRTESTDFLREYENFIKEYATDYGEVNHKNIDANVFEDFFGKDGYKTASFNNYQHFDYQGLKGRILSSSYMPAGGQPGAEEMLDALKKLFDRFQKDGKVILEYDTRIYYGKID